MNDKQFWLPISESLIVGCWSLIVNKKRKTINDQQSWILVTWVIKNKSCDSKTGVFLAPVYFALNAALRALVYKKLYFFYFYNSDGFVKSLKMTLYPQNSEPRIGARSGKLIKFFQYFRPFPSPGFPLRQTAFHGFINSKRQLFFYLSKKDDFNSTVCGKQGQLVLKPICIAIASINDTCK